MADKSNNPDEKRPSNPDIEIEYIIPKKREAESTADESVKGKPLHEDGDRRKKDAEIKRLKKECKELKESHLRELAEKENLRKRLEKEKSEFYQYALSEFLTELLSVLDNFQRALDTSQQGEGSNFQEGVRMISRQLMDVIVKQGVKPIEIKNKAFDPQFHQALETEESDEVKAPEISQELLRGYTLHERLLRPSLVKVRIPKKAKQ